MTRNWLFFGLALLMLSSCVPARKLVYLQKDDVKNRKEIPHDTVLRTHQLKVKEYRIQPLDVLSINFESLGDEKDQFDFLAKLSPVTRSGGNSSSGSLLSGVLVDTEGYVDYAVLGKIKLGGLSLFEARDSLQKVASKYVSDVVVRVRMLNFRYTILGEVNGEQTVVSANTRINIMEAIGLAGGLTELADRANVKVIRQVGDKANIFYVDLLKEELMESPHYYVQQNDIIVVPPLKQRTFRRYFTSNLAVITSSISFVLFIIAVNN